MQYIQQVENDNEEYDNKDSEDEGCASFFL